jgi:hypothetical protein
MRGWRTLCLPSEELPPTNPGSPAHTGCPLRIDVVSEGPQGPLKEKGDVGHARGDLSASPSELSPPPVAPSSLLKPSSSSSFTSANREWAQSSTPQLPRSKTYQGFSSTVLHIGPISIGDDRLPCELLLFALSEAHFKIANILGMWNASRILTDSPIGRLRKCILHGFKV